MIDSSTIEFVAKSFGLIGSIFTAYRLLIEVVLNRKTRLREEYSFVKNFLSDTVVSDQPHPYLVEKGFAAISGKDNLNASEILYLLAQPNPSLSLKRYSAAREKYIEYSEITRRVTYIGKYTDARKRKWVKIRNISGYAIFAALALIPFFFASNLFGNNWKVAIVTITTFLVVFAPQAVLCLREVGKVIKGEKLIESQQITRTAIEEANRDGGK